MDRAGDDDGDFSDRLSGCGWESEAMPTCSSTTEDEACGVDRGEWASSGDPRWWLGDDPAGEAMGAEWWADS